MTIGIVMYDANVMCVRFFQFSSSGLTVEITYYKTYMCVFLCQIDMNLDVRLIQVNERMVKHKLLVAVADWVQSCTGNMQVVLLTSSDTGRLS